MKKQDHETSMRPRPKGRGLIGSVSSFPIGNSALKGRVSTIVNPERIENTRKFLDKKKLDAILLFSGESLNDLSSENTYYLSGFFDVWSHAVLVTKKDAVLFTADVLRAEKECALDVVDARKEKIHAFLNKRHMRRIGIDTGFSFNQWNKLRGKLKRPVFCDISKNMLEIRGIKDKEEISKMRLAAGITKKALDVVQKKMRLFDEGALIKKVKQEFALNNAEPAFTPIVAGDANSANIHYFACNQKYSQILMSDIGARKDFYNSDFTRTHILCKDKEMLQAHDTVARLVDGLLDFVVVGKTCLEIHKYAKDFLVKAGYKKESFSNFHGLGHGVGLDVHEYPRISERAPYKNTVFQENMVFALEPAIYFKNKFGIRIENTFLLTKKGLNVL